MIVNSSEDTTTSLDISNILNGYDPLTDSLSDFATVTNDDGVSNVWIDSTGSGGNFTNVVSVFNNDSLSIDDLIADANLQAQANG